MKIRALSRSASPLEGMWIANFIFIPISIILIFMATNNIKFPKITLNNKKLDNLIISSDSEAVVGCGSTL